MTLHGVCKETFCLFEDNYKVELEDNLGLEVISKWQLIALGAHKATTCSKCWYIHLLSLLKGKIKNGFSRSLHIFFFKPLKVVQIQILILDFLYYVK